MIISLFIMCLMFGDYTFKKREHRTRKHMSDLLLNLYRIKAFFSLHQNTIQTFSCRFAILVSSWTSF